MSLNQYISINDLTCKLTLEDISLAMIYNDGRRTDGQVDGQTDSHVMTIPLDQGVKICCIYYTILLYYKTKSTHS